MLTPVYRQVKSGAPVITDSAKQSARAAQQALVSQLLEPLLARRRPDRILLLRHINAGELQVEPVKPAQLIRLSTENSVDARLRCRMEALPFEGAAFDMVILHHMVCDGAEPFLPEVFRVLAAGGDLVISGLNSSGLRTRIVNRKHRMPALKLDRVCNLLKSHSINVEQCLLMGLGGFSRPAPKATWHGLGYPFADRVVLHGHHQSNIKGSNILRFKHIQPATLASASLDGCSTREAVS